jgi:hypothetical protein
MGFPSLVPQYQAEIAIERTGPEERKIKFNNATDHTHHHG